MNSDLAVRKIHNIRVLTREKGSWLIAAIRLWMKRNVCRERSRKRWALYWIEAMKDDTAAANSGKWPSKK
jgi:hypothetical protein